MNNTRLFNQDSGNGGGSVPPPPPPPNYNPPPPPSGGYNPPPPPPPSGGYNPPPPPPPGYNPPPPPPPFGNTQYGGSNNDKASSNAIIILVMGIASIVFCGCLLGIPAWIMGKNEIAKINSGESAEAGRGFAKAGMWLGIIATILSVLGTLFWVFYFILLGGLKD
ncbi:MAG: DUF4190 domain-containing protein [Bacteroidetes bacterium]|nr:DUF4190 domain-containing protein [Bacteroidota bacterium]